MGDPGIATNTSDNRDSLKPEASAPDHLSGASLQEVYNHYFRAEIADSDDLREWSFRLRYQVYCVENDYERASENSGERETDELDDQSLHGLLVHRLSGSVVGTTRLILPKMNGKSAEFPIRTVCSDDFLDDIVNRVPIVATNTSDNRDSLKPEASAPDHLSGASLQEVYNHYFRAEIADSDDLREWSFRLRKSSELFVVRRLRRSMGGIVAPLSKLRW